MTLANIPVGLDRTESACPQLPADVANGFPLRPVFGKLHQQVIGKLVAGFVAVDVGRDHLDRAGLVERLHEFRGVLLAFESSERPRGLVAGFLRQPFPCFTLIVFLQERIHKDAVNVKWLHAVFASQLGGLAAKSRQHFAICRRRVIRFRADGQPVEVKPFREQGAIAQPDPISSTEVAANGRDFDLEFAIVVPAPLDARAVDQPVFAKPPPRFIPMAADTVKQSVLVRFFRSADAVPVPGADNPVPATISQGRSLAELSISIKYFLDDGAHDSHIRFYETPLLPSLFNTGRSKRPARICSSLPGHGKGANSTRPHERHGKVPLREARQAAPDGARASAALSSSKILPFSRGTWPLRRKDYGFAVISYIAANSIAEGICNKSRLRLQPSRKGLQRKIQMRTNAGEPTSRRPATIPRDENLEANSRRRRKAQGGTEATNRSILDLSAAGLSFPVVFIADTATSRMARPGDCRSAKRSEFQKVP
jgi:hypothetical protein